MFTRAVTVILAVGLGLCSAVSAEPLLRWEPAAAVVSIDQEVTVSIMLDEPLDVRTFEVFVQFDPDLIATVGGGPGALFDGFNTFPGFAEEQPGQWHGYSVILGAEVWTTGPGELFEITVTGLQPGISPLSTIAVTLLPPGGGQYPDAELTAGSIEVVSSDVVDILLAIAQNTFAGVDIKILANIQVGSSPISTVTLYYTVDGGVEQNEAAVDQGDGIWVASFGQHPGGAEIAWRLAAVDELSNEALWPYDDGWLTFRVIEPGRIVAWGLNNDGQCDEPEPNMSFVAVAGGERHSLGLSDDGVIKAWGDNIYGQCNVPEPNADFVAVIGGGRHSLGLKSDGSIVAWGRNNLGQCNVPSPNNGFVAMSAGYAHNLGLKNDGTIVTWGTNNEGQCDVPEPNEGFMAVAAGRFHSLALRTDGSIVAWGLNDEGQCDVPEPNSDFVALIAGNAHSLGLKSDGSIVAWGWNNSGQCNVPAPNEGFVAMAAGWNHSLGLRGTGEIAAWGSNYEGQNDVPEPNSGFVTVAASLWHSLAIVTLDWVDVATGTVLGESSPSYGASWGFIGSSWNLPDLFVAYSTESPNNHSRLFKNLGDNTFEDISSGIITESGLLTGAYWGDYDNDGLLDLLVLSSDSHPSVWRNLGDGEFVDVTPAPLMDVTGSWGGAWVDYNADGWLDLFVTSTNGLPKLLRNTGDGTFAEAHTLPNAPIRTEGCAWGDYNNSGLPDLYLVAQGGLGGNRLYRNDGNGIFVDVTSGPLGDDGSGQGAAWGDYNNDGLLDLAITNWGVGTKVLRNRGNDEFTVIDIPALSGRRDGQSVVWGDFDNDGKLDLYFTFYSGPNLLLRNEGNDVFPFVPAAQEEDPVNDAGQTIAAAWADSDGNGALDLFVSNSNGHNRLFRNDLDLSDRNWLQVRLTGYPGRSDAAAIGARITLVSGDLTQIREIEGGTGYLSQNSLIAHFGLGDRSSVDQLTVRWTCGTETLHPVSGVNQIVEIQNPTSVPDDPASEEVPAILAISAVAPNPFNPRTTVWMDLPISGMATLAIHDLRGRLVRTLWSGRIEAGRHPIMWDGLDDRGAQAPSGVYLVRLVTAGEQKTAKITLAK